MSHKIIMPSLGMSQDTGTIVKWKKAEGDHVESGEELMDIETDKAIQAIEAPVSGYVKKIFFKENVPVPVGEVVAELGMKSEVGDDTDSSIEKLNHELKKDPDLSSSVTDGFEEKFSNEQVNIVPKKNKSDLPNAIQSSPQIPVKLQPTSTKILASAKVKYHSHQLGIPLVNIANQLNKTVLHYKDLELYQQTPTLVLSGSEIPGSVNHTITMEIATDGTALKQLQERKGNISIQEAIQEDILVEVRYIVGVLVLSAFRKSHGDSSRSLSALIQSSFIGFENELLTDADLLSLKELNIQKNTKDDLEQSRFDIKIIDLLDTAITFFQSQSSNRNEEMLLTMCYDQSLLKIRLQTSTNHTYQKNLLFLTTLANYLQEPILYLR